MDTNVLNSPWVLMAVLAVGMLAMIVPALVLVFFTRDSRSANAG